MPANCKHILFLMVIIQKAESKLKGNFAESKLKGNFAESRTCRKESLTDTPKVCSNVSTLCKEKSGCVNFTVGAPTNILLHHAFKRKSRFVDSQYGLLNVNLLAIDYVNTLNELTTVHLAAIECVNARLVVYSN